jgi:hypothetical protein
MISDRLLENHVHFADRGGYSSRKPKKMINTLSSARIAKLSGISPPILVLQDALRQL